MFKNLNFKSSGFFEKWNFTHEFLIKVHFHWCNKLLIFHAQWCLLIFFKTKFKKTIHQKIMIITESLNILFAYLALLLVFQHLIERSWYAVTETCLAFTVFRDDFSPKFVALFTLLLFLKCFHWLAEDRVDYVSITKAFFVLPFFSTFTNLTLSCYM